MSKIDVILPTYNQGCFIDTCIPSILEQTFKDFSLIIINDGSKDDTDDKIKKYLNDKRIVYFCQKNKGLPSALNVGHELGKSKYCTWLSTDNISQNNQLEFLIDYIEKNNYDFVHSNFTKIKNNKRTLIDMSKKKGRLGVGNIGPSFLYRREVWEKFRYDESIHGAEDIKFYAQIVLSDFTMGHLNISLVDYNCQENSISKKMGNVKIKKLVDNIKKELGL